MGVCRVQRNPLSERCTPKWRKYKAGKRTRVVPSFYEPPERLGVGDRVGP